MKLVKIISGGQTGVDQAGLFAAKEVGIPTGGWAPKGWRTEVGPAPWLANYGLVEHTSDSYPPRTAKNIHESRCTLLISAQPMGPGSRLTRSMCESIRRPFWHIVALDGHTMATTRRWFVREQPDNLVLNVAGMRESKQPGIQAEACRWLVILFRSLNGDALVSVGGSPDDKGKAASA